MRHVGPITLLLVSMTCGACGDASKAPPSAPATPAQGASSQPAAQPTAQAAPATPAAAQAATQAAAAQPAALVGTPQVKEFTEDQLQRYIASVADIRAFGTKVQAQGGADPSQLENLFQGLGNVAEFNQVLGKHGFDQASFLSVHHNVVWTYGALMLDEQEPEMAKAKAEQEAALEQMKGMLSEQQLAAMKQQLETANKQVESMRDVPAGNKALLAKHRQEFETAIGKS